MTKLPPPDSIPPKTPKRKTSIPKAKINALLPEKTDHPEHTFVLKKWLTILAIVVVVIAISVIAYQMSRPKGPGVGFLSGNGRIEATELDVAAKIGGRVEDILVYEGDFVNEGQIVAHMQVQVLEAQFDEAQAHAHQMMTAVASTNAQVKMRDSDKHAAEAAVEQRKSEAEAAQLRFNRSLTLEKEGASSGQELDDDRAKLKSANAAILASEAQVEAAQAAIVASQAQVAGALSAVDAANATIARINADIMDSSLKAPRDGRIQYRIAQPGEVVASGGKVLNLVDLSDVYMTFFVPDAAAGKLALGGEVHIVLDAAPQYVIPANITFVSSTAQFTPKTVETASERQKLMFKVKARIDRELLQKHLKVVKTGLPGVAWLKLDPSAEWPKALVIKVPK
jgi:HlyD family secretion protein